jgi:hypothetical protein
MRKPWTKKELQILRAKYPIMPTTELANKLGRSLCSVYGQAYILNIRKDDDYLLTPESGRMCKGSTIGKNTRFKKGQHAWNKNTKGLTGRNKTSFKPGQMPNNYRPVGSIRTDKDGYWMIKVADPRKWELLHRNVWKKAHGPIPNGHAIIFKDGNKQNCALENLAIISREDNMLRNTIHRYPEEIKSAIKTLTKLKKTISNHGTKQN